MSDFGRTPSPGVRLQSDTRPFPRPPLPGSVGVAYAALVLTIVAIVLAVTVLPQPWGWIAVITAAVIDVAETAFFVWWSKQRRAAVGAETLVGRRAVVVRALSPRGQVKLDGETWEALFAAEVPPGEEVVVTGIEGLVLEVESPE